MERDEGLRTLGLPDRANGDDIHRAYKARSRALKLQMLGATRVDLKERHRHELRELIRAREAALGHATYGGWRCEPLGVSGRRVLHLMGDTHAALLDRAGAREFLELDRTASNDEVLAAYRLRSRALIRRFAVARDDGEMASIRKARSKLRTIRNFALASA